MNLNEKNFRDVNSIRELADQVTSLADQLTDEEFNFCEEYLKNMTAPIALAVARALPYEDMPHRRAESFLNNPKLLDYLDLRRKIIRRTFITKDDVMLRLYQALDKCTQPIPIIDKKGHPTGEYSFDSRGATKILEILSKHFGIADIDKDKKDKNITPVAPKVSVNKDDLEEFINKFNDEY
jgi:hypothetical protein